MVSADDRRGLVHLLVQLIVARGSEAELMAVEADSDSEGENDPLLATVRRRHEVEDAASPCAFTRRELAAQAALLLGMQLELFGAAEAARLFHSRSNHRTANLRTELDAALQRAFWGREAACASDDAMRALLAALAPRDRLRFLGLVRMGLGMGADLGRGFRGKHCSRWPLAALAGTLRPRLPRTLRTPPSPAAGGHAVQEDL